MANEIRVRLALAAALAFVGAGALAAAEKTRARYTMGTLLRVTVQGDNAGACERAAEAFLDEVDRWDRLLSTYKADSEVSRLNRRAPEETIVSPDTAAVLAAALEWAKKTRGAFDPTVGPLIQLWKFNTDAPRLPAAEEVAAVLPQVGFDKVEAKDAAIRLSRRGMAFDFGAIGKGWALDRAWEKIESEPGLNEVVADFGGQLLLWSRTPKTWPAGVRGSSAPAFQIEGNGSLATSAATERFLVAPDPKDPSRGNAPRRYGHILDPRTGFPAEPCESVTVWAPTATAADALSTAIFVMGPEKGLELARQEDVSVAMSFWDARLGRQEVRQGDWFVGGH
jgi:FAD:protein FMN transferase